MTTLQIEIPEGYEIEEFDKHTGKVSFREKPKKITERIKTVDDLLSMYGMSREEFDKQYDNLSSDEKAYKLLKLLCSALNEGWKPDWDNPNELKYYPWFEMGGSSGFRFYDYSYWRSAVGSRLCFKSKELAEYAGKQFIDLYKQFMLSD